MDRKILIVSPVPTHPQTAGNQQRVYSLCSALKAEGFAIHFVYVNMMEGDADAMAETWDEFRYVRCNASFSRRSMDRLNDWLWKCFRRAAPYPVDSWYESVVEAPTKELCEKHEYAAVIVEYVFLSKIFERIPSGPLKLIDMHDLFAGRAKIFRLTGKKPSFFFTSRESEIGGFKRADAVLAIQSEEARVIRNAIAPTETVIVGHLCGDPPKKQVADVPVSKALFVGSGNDVNVDALVYCLNEIFPLIKRRVPEFELVVVGDVGEALSTLPAGCFRLGRVDDLSAMYEDVGIVINPARFGTGLKIKTIEALANGKPLVTTNAGAQGLKDGVGTAFLVGETAEEFADHCCDLLRSPERRMKLAKQGMEYAAAHHHKAFEPLRKLLRIAH